MELHLSPRVIGKGSKGRTACGSAAYRSGSKIVDNDGVVHDFRYKKERVSGGVELPEGAPEELRNPQTLWQRHEIHDIRKDAQIYRDIEFSLPNELADESNPDYTACERVARGMAAPLTERGMCVQWDIHDKYTYKDVEDGTVVYSPKKMRPDREYIKTRNLHVHMMLTMRELNEDGTFGNKVREWNKFNGGLNIADLLRPKAAELMNKELEAIRSNDHVEYLSFAERNIDQIPTTHVGTTATAMERKGIKTDRGSERRYIEWLNEIHRANMKEAKTKVKHLDEIIQQAQEVTATEEKFTGWDALYAYLRDLHRAQASVAGEIRRLEKISAAYKNADKKYLEWAGCDLESVTQRMAVETMLKTAQLYREELKKSESIVLENKGRIKLHNDKVYASNKVYWDEYRINSNKRSINYLVRRMNSLENYIRSLRQGIFLLDIIFQTSRWKEYIDTVNALKDQGEELRREYNRKRAELEGNQEALEQHKRELKDAKKAEKKAQKRGQASR